jgi:hypothetical protein
MNEQDPILDELWGPDAGEAPKVDFGEPYGVGTWPNAVLMDVEPIEDNAFGYRLKLILNLKGDEGMKYTGRLDLPRTVEENGDHDLYERACRANERIRNNVAGLLLGAELLKGKVFDVNGADTYERMMNIFRHGIGRNVPVRVKIQQRLNKDTGKYENTDFTEIVAIKARKK